MMSFSITLIFTVTLTLSKKTGGGRRIGGVESERRETS
jgi:hypothetical protein